MLGSGSVGLLLVAGAVGNGKNARGVEDLVVGVAANRSNNLLGVVLKGQSLAASAGARDHALETHGRHVDGGLSTGEDEKVVEETAKGSTQNRSNNGDPEVVTTGSPNLSAVADNVSGETRTKVTSGIHGVTGFPAKRGTETKDKEDENQRTEVSSRQVVGIVDSVDTEHEDGGSDELGEKHTGACHEGSRVGAENASSRGGTANGTDTNTLVHVKSRLVVTVNNEGTEEGTHELSKDIDGELLPGKAAEDTVGKGDGGVEMTTRDTTRAVDTKHDTNTPRPRDGLVGTVGVLGHDDLGNDTISEENNHHGTDELGEGFSKDVPNARPKRQV